MLEILDDNERLFNLGIIVFVLFFIGLVITGITGAFIQDAREHELEKMMIEKYNGCEMCINELKELRED